MPKRLAWPLGTLLPLVELAAAGALLHHRSATAGAVAVLVLLLGFSLAIALNLLRGRTPECRCFGQLHSMPVSWRVVGRNLALAALAAALVAGGPARLGPIESTSAAVALGCSALFLAARRARRREARAPRETPGLPFGSPAPDFELPSLIGGAVTLRSLLDIGKPVLLVFADTSCGPCRALAPELATWQADGVDLTIAVLEGGARPAAVDEYGRSFVLCPPDESVAQAYRAHGTPSAVLVDASGRIASSIAPGADAIRRLVGGTAPVAPGRAEERALTRFELVAKLASAGLVLAATRAAPALAEGTGATPTLVLCKYGPRCGGRCCPKTARCRQRAGKKRCVCPDGRKACGSKCCPPTFLCRRAPAARRSAFARRGPDGALAAAYRSLIQRIAAPADARVRRPPSVSTANASAETAREPAQVAAAPAIAPRPDLLRRHVHRPERGSDALRPLQPALPGGPDLLRRRLQGPPARRTELR